VFAVSSTRTQTVIGNMSEHKLKNGDLVSIEPWDCEGVEMPWGWERSSTNIGGIVETRHSRKKLNPGALGMIIDLSPEPNDHYSVVIGERRLNVPLRFLHKVQT